MHILAHPAHMLAHPRTSTHIPSPNLSFEAFAMVMGAYRASIWSQATQHHKKTRNLLFYSMQSMILCNQHCQKRFNLCWIERAYAKYPWASLGEPEVQKISCHIQLCRYYCIQTLNCGFFTLMLSILDCWGRLIWFEWCRNAKFLTNPAGRAWTCGVRASTCVGRAGTCEDVHILCWTCALFSKFLSPTMIFMGMCRK